MALAHAHRQPPIPLNTEDSLLFNPFTEGQEEVAQGEDLLTHPYRAVSSALPPKRHIRSRTEVYPSRNPSGGNLHPLRSSGLTNGSGDPGITRPHLSRIVKVGTLVDVPPIQSDNTNDLSSLSAEEKDVLVHEVDSMDSLAGVSLKYGISLADLRRANHLWTSDSIHFRKVLYIPLEKASRAPQLQKDFNLISITPQEELPNPMESSHNIPDHNIDKESLSTEHSVGTIRRIPASHLSFFPPSSLKDSVDLSTQSPQYVRIAPAPNRPSHYTHNRFASSPSLTSILTALPIAASTRDTIIARLSFDSLSSGYSDGEEVERLHDGLELDDVRHVLLSNGLANDHVTTDDTQYLHPSISQPDSHHVPCTAKPSTTRNTGKGHSIHPSAITKAGKPPTRSPPSTSYSGQRRPFSDSPKAYIPSHPQIRTAQLEPSPGMQLPLSTGGISRSKGKKSTRASLLDIDFELEDTQSPISNRS